MRTSFGIHMKGGVITERDADFCTVRIRAPAGILSVEQVRGIASIAKKYGSGLVHCTTRQTIEIPHVNPKLLKKIEKSLEKNGTPVGSERDEIVNIIACPGVERCKFANIDTISLAKKIDHKLFGKEMPVKMRIAISGCPNACTSPMLNEIGIMGRIRPLRTAGLCTGCGTCVEYCKENAIIIKNGISILDPTNVSSVVSASNRVLSISSRLNTAITLFLWGEDGDDTPVSGGNCSPWRVRTMLSMLLKKL